MNFPGTRRKFLGVLASAVAWLSIPATAGTNSPVPRRKGGGGGRGGRGGRDYALPPEWAAFSLLSLVLGRVSNKSVTVSSLANQALEGFFEYGTAPDNYTNKTGLLAFAAGQPVETVFENFQPDTPYFYRLSFRKPGETAFQARPEGRFHTQRAPGSPFMFGIQGDSHPERPQMSDPDLYARTLLHAASGKPDLYICMGDDFSVDTLRTVNMDTVGERYTLQRPFLGLVAQSAPIFLLNGNHEQASLFNFNQSDVRHDVAVWAQEARNRYYPTPAPDGFYSGDTTLLKSIGLLKDYYSWTWGDALFVVLDNYWQTPVLVDAGFRDQPGGPGPGGRGPGDRGPGGRGPGDRGAGGRGRGGRGGPGDPNRDWWGLSLGEAQYQWFKRTLEQSKARHKFVFAHHVLGSGRGGVDEAGLFEWGGRNRRGDWEFDQKAARFGVARSPAHGQTRRHDFFPGARPPLRPTGA